MGEYDAQKMKPMRRCTGRAYRRELWPLAGLYSPLRLICCYGLIAVLACSFGSTTGEDGKIQSLVNLPDVVVPSLLWPALSRVVRNWCQGFGSVAGLLLAIAVIQIYGQLRSQRYRKLADARFGRISTGVDRIGAGVEEQGAVLDRIGAGVDSVAAYLADKEGGRSGNENASDSAGEGLIAPPLRLMGRPGTGKLGPQRGGPGDGCQAQCLNRTVRSAAGNRA